jgi:hypothetical protein
MTQIPLSSDARERFLMEIAAVVPKHRISEVYLFPPLRQGPMETGVAVIAAMPVGASPIFAMAEATATDAETTATATADASVTSEAASPERIASGESAEALASTEPALAADEEYVEGAKISSRHVVYSARYRWTRKGPERGKWECEVVAEADAPLLTVEAVVQGVRQRANEPVEPEKLDGDAVRAMLAAAERHWATTA